MNIENHLDELAVQTSPYNAPAGQAGQSSTGSNLSAGFNIISANIDRINYFSSCDECMFNANALGSSELCN